MGIAKFTYFIAQANIYLVLHYNGGLWELDDHHHTVHRADSASAEALLTVCAAADWLQWIFVIIIVSQQPEEGSSSLKIITMCALLLSGYRCLLK